MSLRWLACCIAMLGVSHAAAAQASAGAGAPPAEVLETLYAGAISESECGELMHRIRLEPQAFVAPIRDVLWLPNHPAELFLERRDAFARRSGALRAVVPALGRDLAEPVLVEYFARGRSLLEELNGMVEEAKRAFEAEERAGRPTAEERRMKVVRLGRFQAGITGTLNQAVLTAEALRSDALVDPVLGFYEAGLDDQQGGTMLAYAVSFSKSRPDVIPRMRQIIESPRTNANVRRRAERVLLAHFNLPDPRTGVVPNRYGGLPAMPPEKPPAPKPAKPSPGVS